MSQSFNEKLPGENLTPVPDVCCVLRLAQLPKDFEEKGNILAVQLDDLEKKDFILSSKDKESSPPHLSVWVDCLTTPEQAYRFLPIDSNRKLALRLKVNEIRKIKGNSGECFYPNLLDVIWVYMYMINTATGESIRDNRPGAEGHSGITGLDEESTPDKLTKNQKKILRKDLRAQLAELASKDCFKITDL